jgi:hypothetical protein
MAVVANQGKAGDSLMVYRRAPGYGNFMRKLYWPRDDVLVPAENELETGPLRVIGQPAITGSLDPCRPSVLVS